MISPRRKRYRKAMRSGRARRAERKRRRAYEEYLRSPQWAWIRRLVIARDGGACVLCSSRERLHVHHIHYRTLCESCHKSEHNRRPRNRRAKGPYAAVRDLAACPELDAEFAARLAREA